MFRIHVNMGQRTLLYCLLLLIFTMSNSFQLQETNGPAEESFIMQGGGFLIKGDADVASEPQSQHHIEPQEFDDDLLPLEESDDQLQVDQFYANLRKQAQAQQQYIPGMRVEDDLNFHLDRYQGERIDHQFMSQEELINLQRVQDLPQQRGNQLQQHQGSVYDHNRMVDAHGNVLQRIDDRQSQDLRGLKSYAGETYQMQVVERLPGDTLIRIFDPSSQSFVLKHYAGPSSTQGYTEDEYKELLTKIQDKGERKKQLARLEQCMKEMESENFKDGERLIEVYDPTTKKFSLQSMTAVTQQLQIRQAEADKCILVKVFDQKTQSFTLTQYHGEATTIGYTKDEYLTLLKKIENPIERTTQIKRFTQTVNKLENKPQGGDRLLEVLDPVTKTYSLQTIQAVSNQMQLKKAGQENLMVRVFDPQSQGFVIKPYLGESTSKGYTREEYEQQLNRITDVEQRHTELARFNQAIVQLGPQSIRQGDRLIEVQDPNKKGFKLQNIDSVQEQLKAQLVQAGEKLRLIEEQKAQSKMNAYQGGVQQLDLRQANQGQSLMVIRDFDERDPSSIRPALPRKSQLQPLDENGVPLNRVTDQLSQQPGMGRFNGDSRQMEKQTDGTKLQPIDDTNDTKGIKQIQKQNGNQFESIENEPGNPLQQVRDDKPKAGGRMAAFRSQTNQQLPAVSQQGTNLRKLEDTPEQIQRLGQKTGSHLQSINDEEHHGLLNRINDHEPEPQSVVHFDQFESRIIMEQDRGQSKQLQEIKDQDPAKQQQRAQQEVNILHNNPKQGNKLQPLGPGDQQKAQNMGVFGNQQQNIGLKGGRDLQIANPEEDLEQPNPLDKNIIQFRGMQNQNPGTKLNQIVPTKQGEGPSIPKHNDIPRPLSNSNSNATNMANTINNLIDPNARQQNERNDLKDVWSINPIIFGFQQFQKLHPELSLPRPPSQFDELYFHDSNESYADRSRMRPDELVKYRSYTKHDQLHGRGILMKYPTGAIYDGYWDDGQFAWGVVLEVNPQKVLTRYFGCYNKQYARKHDTQGQMTWYEPKGWKFYICRIPETFEKADEHIGRFVVGQIRGQGTRTYKNQDVYTGEWKNNDRHGKGVLEYFKPKDKYEGQFFEGKFHGRGTYIHAANGTREEGEYDNGKSYGEHKVFDDKNEPIKTINYGMGKQK